MMNVWIASAWALLIALCNCCCPENYFIYRGKACFKFLKHIEGKTVNEAKELCKNNGGMLASIDDQQQLDWLHFALIEADGHDTGQESVIIGLESIETLNNGTKLWHWIDNSISTFRPWQTGEPGSDDDEKCVALEFNITGEGHKIADWKCTESFTYTICRTVPNI